MREETLRAANLALIGYHQKLPLTAVFGSGTLSSSDGQRFPTRGKSVTAKALSRYFAHEGLSTYTHVTDQHTTYGTKIIVATKREAHYVLDEILGNATDIPITEHATDTHGVTLVNFGLFDLLGLQLSPRIRDLGKITLYRTGLKSQVEMAFPLAGPLLTRRANLDLIAAHWDDLLRLAGSLKFGHATASLLVGKLSASSRQNALAAALKEYGALRRTIYAARYLSDPAYRRKISRQLNKGGSLHALKRDLLYAHEGTIRARHLESRPNKPGASRWSPTPWSPGRPSTTVWRWNRCATLGAASTTRRSPTSPQPTARTSTSSAPSTLTSKGNSPSSAPPGTGPCACATPCSDAWPRRGSFPQGDRGKGLPPTRR
ncbi:hypothetical protein GCM10010466_49530 [Planomonospora alba]|uniref:Tn3 transposase DDE domain-containing protein n=1 Tax=Planomonospora alba TaxID=161354 RepID=A0ABP6NNR0_9ACTN